MLYLFCNLRLLVNNWLCTLVEFYSINIVNFIMNKINKIVKYIKIIFIFV